MGWIYLLMTLWIIYQVVRFIIGAGKALVKRQTTEKGHIDFFDAKLKPDLAHALLLAHPFAIARVGGSYYHAEQGQATEELRARWQHILLNYLDLRTPNNEADIAKIVTQQLNDIWFRIGLNPLRKEDNPLDAIAFACARTAFCVRLCFFLGWIDEPCCNHLLRCNAVRAKDCFFDWNDYGKALARGRAQWIAGNRSDPIGKAMHEEEMTAWANNPKHPWRQTPWLKT